MNRSISLLAVSCMLALVACDDDNDNDTNNNPPTPTPLSTVELGTAGNFVILGRTALTTTGIPVIRGDIGLSPSGADSIIGFTLGDSATDFNSSPFVTGKVYASDYADPTPANLTAAMTDLDAAFTDVMGRTDPDSTELGGGNLQGLTLTSGLYEWSTDVTIPSSVTLSGDGDDIWIFRIAGDLLVGDSAVINLTGGALPKHVFWEVGGQVTLGSHSNFKGVILSQSSIAIGNGATVLGRVFAKTAVTIDSATVTNP